MSRKRDRWFWRKGVTMVEMIVVMMMIGIFLPMISMVFDLEICMAERMADANRVSVISEMILERISDEISRRGLPEQEKTAEFCEDLFLDDFYMGYEVNELTFQKEEPMLHPDVVRIDLTLMNRRSKAVYRTCRYVKMNDVQTEDEIMLIDEDAIGLQGDD
ncbi:MAG: prepilin-type N-terminal cleavage/methylation domain-containing protein [Brotaphodocola sp.]